MFIIDDIIETLVIGGGIALLKNAIQSVTEENERKTKDLETLSRRYERDIEKEKANIEQIQKRNNLQEQLAFVDLQFKTSKENADAVYLEYERSRKTLNELNEAISKLFKAKNDLKEKLNKISKNSDEYNDFLARIRILNPMIQNTIKNRDKIKEEREKILAGLRESNHITKELNEKRKKIQQQMQILDSAQTTNHQETVNLFEDDAYNEGRRLRDENDRFWASDEGKKLKGFWDTDEGKRLKKESEQFWASDEGKKLKGFWDTDEGKRLKKESEQFWASDEGKQLVERNRRFWAGYNEKPREK